MGRMFYQVPKRVENERAVHILSTEIGTVVLAIREPELGERAYNVGIDNTIRDAVRELLADWTDDGPGWLQSSELAAAPWARPHAGDETFTVTILAAYAADQTSLEYVAVRGCDCGAGADVVDPDDHTENCNGVPVTALDEAGAS